MKEKKLWQELTMDKLFPDADDSTDGDVFVNKLNPLLRDYGLRVSYKWWLFHIYKRYDDGKEHHIGQCGYLNQLLKILRDELK